MVKILLRDFAILIDSQELPYDAILKESVPTDYRIRELHRKELYFL